VWIPCIKETTTMMMMVTMMMIIIIIIIIIDFLLPETSRLGGDHSPIQWVPRFVSGRKAAGN
jgi:hypothetical protein